MNDKKANGDIDNLELKLDETQRLNTNADNDFSDDIKSRNRKIRRKCIKNLLAFSLSYLIQFSASSGINNLQSSLNGILGITSLVVLTLSFTLTCLFVPLLMSKYIGYKWSLILSQIGQFLYIIANFAPSYWTLMPSSFIVGISNAVLWTFQGSFIAELEHDYSKTSSKSSETNLIKFYGVFMILYQLNQVLGNLISSFVLFRTPKMNHNLGNNISSINISNNINQTIQELCGVNDSPERKDEFVKPDQQTVYLLCSIYSGLSVVGILILVIFLDNIKPSNAKDTIVETVKKSTSIFFYLKTWLLVPFLAFLSFTSTFAVVDLSKSFISCPYGVNKVGIVFSCWGLASSVFSFLIGPLIKFIGRFVCLIIVFIISFLIFVFLYFWTPNENNLYVIIVIAVIFGVLETCWAVINNATIVSVYRDCQQAAFSLNRFFTSLLFFVSFSYSGYLSVKNKLYLLMCVTTVALISFILFEWIIRKEKKSHNKTLKENPINK